MLLKHIMQVLAIAFENQRLLFTGSLRELRRRRLPEGISGKVGFGHLTVRLGRPAAALEFDQRFQLFLLNWGDFYLLVRQKTNLLELRLGLGSGLLVGDEDVSLRFLFSDHELRVFHV